MSYEISREAAELLEDVRRFCEESVKETCREADRTGVKGGPTAYTEVVVDIGSANGVETKHLVGAITERTGLSSKDIGKIQIATEYSVVAVPANKMGTVLEAMQGCKICGKPTHTIPLAETEGSKTRSSRGESKNARFAAQRVASWQSGRSGGPTRRKRKMPDFEG